MKINKLKRHFKKAFTLVELIIVIAVIAILAVFLVPNFSNVLGDAAATNVKSDTANVKNIVMAYIGEVGAVPVANIDTNADNIIKITNGSKTYFPGISTAMFEETAEEGKYYVIDMDLLTKPQINIEDRVSVKSAKLPSLPSTTAILNVKSGSSEDKISAQNNNTLLTNKKVKNSSVVYVIDKGLNVYAAYSKQIKSNTTDAAKINEIEDFVILREDGTSQHSTFKTTVTENQDKGTVQYGLAVDDSNYN